MSNDPKCFSCTYRVFDRRASSAFTTMMMVCLHPQVGKKDCAQVRIPTDAPCGPDAQLWKSRAAEMRRAAAHDTSCVGAFARARPGRTAP